MRRFGVDRAKKVQPPAYEANETNMPQMPHCARTLPMEGPTAESFDEIVEKNRAWMLALARRYLRDPALAEDCVQDALYSVHMNLHQFESRSSLKAWLRRITINCALMILRRRKRYDDQSIEQPHFQESLANGTTLSGWSAQEPKCTLQSLMLNETREMLRQEIVALPAKHREILELGYLKELSIREIAARLLISEGAVKVRLHRARSALRESLQPVAEDLSF